MSETVAEKIAEHHEDLMALAESRLPCNRVARALLEVSEEEGQ